MTTTLRQAIFAALKAAPTVTNLLPAGSNGVLLSGRVEPSTPFPCLALEMGPQSGRTADLPFTAATFNVYAYVGSLAASTVTFVDIDAILDAVRGVLHGASLTLSGVGQIAYYCAYDNYRSGDHFDERRRAYYRYDRYRVWTSLSAHYH